MIGNLSNLSLGVARDLYGAVRREELSIAAMSTQAGRHGQDSEDEAQEDPRGNAASDRDIFLPLFS